MPSLTLQEYFFYNLHIIYAPIMAYEMSAPANIIP